jgi:hypothetical protein
MSLTIKCIVTGNYMSFNALNVEPKISFKTVEPLYKSISNFSRIETSVTYDTFCKKSICFSHDIISLYSQ